MNPEAKARIEIDAQLVQAGYVLQDKNEFNPAASLGVVVREYATDSGPCDYLIFIDKKPVGLIEAKARNKGQNLTTVAEQTRRYAESKFKYIPNIDIRFAYEATDVLVHFTDYRDENYRTREIYSFHRSEQLKAWLDEDDTLRNRLRAFPELDTTGFRDCQIKAINGLEKSFAENKPRALIQMATGAGKTFTAITNAYRLLKFAKAKRILFLVDTKNLGEQAEEEFKKYKPTDDARLFPELYSVSRLNSSHIPEDASICISTIQRMYSILRGQELDERAEEEPLSDGSTQGGPRDVCYNKQYPPEYFDFIIIDECHRSIYNIWQQVLDYFDAFLIGLTATPDKRTFAFFKQNVVSEYTHEEAVIDGVNVGGDIFIIDTEVGKNGATILKQVVEKRDRLSREKRWEQLDEDITYGVTSLDKDIVNPSQLRMVIKTFKDKITTEIFPGRDEVPKTLIFAKTDSHADDIIKVVREEFGMGNDFCKKITYQTKEDPKSVLAEFRNGYNPRIAVTVDMIATGTDVKPLECLIFMRNVRSKNYFEQMLGRGRRVLGYDDLVRVSPSATTNKINYAVVDAVGVTKSLKSETRPLERKPTVSMKDLMMSVVLGARDDDAITSLAGRLLRLNGVLNAKEQKQASELAGGVPLNEIARQMLDAFDEDVIEDQAEKQPDGTVSGEALDKAQAVLIDKAVEPLFNPEYRSFLENVRKSHDQIIDNTNIDTVVYAGWDDDHEEKAAEVIKAFRQFLEENKDELDALQIIYADSYRQRPLTLDMIKEVYEKMHEAPYSLSGSMLWRAYEVQQQNVVSQLMDIISIIRFEIGKESKLISFADHVRAKFRDWIFEKNAGSDHFTDEQMEWLRMLRDSIVVSASVTTEDLELTPFDDKGGLAKFYELFKGQYETVLSEINLALVA
ncbi:MAG: type I restriction-modification enzyme R subunit C-terminal domain-containing protein [Raoultibacter sp.]